MQTQRIEAFVCPTCHKDCPTLRDWLSCHARELRAVTEILGRTNAMALAAVTRGHVTPGVWNKAQALLGTEEAHDRAA